MNDDVAVQILAIPLITLTWSDWTPWPNILGQKGGQIPKHPGVYEVKNLDSGNILTIGKTDNLHRRVQKALVQGKHLHSAGTRIRAVEDVTRLVVRWAVTDRPAAAEEELHRLHIQQFGRLPVHTLSTR